MAWIFLKIAFNWEKLANIYFKAFKNLIVSWLEEKLYILSTKI